MKPIETWDRLVAGSSLEGLGCGAVDGRVDLRGLSVPKASIVREYDTASATVGVLAGLTELRGVAWSDIDFSGSDLRSLRFFNCRITNCRFDKARCGDWRMWGTTIVDTTFRAADLREAALGGIYNGTRNAFCRCKFEATDLRGTAYASAEFRGCTFSDARLDDVDFQGSVFEDCTFDGKLSGTIFNRGALHADGLPPNSMKNVDFRGARLFAVEFRGLDLDTVRLPEDEGHIILHDYIATLDRVLAQAATRDDRMSRRLAAYVRACRKWAGPHQEKGVVNKDELRELVGEGAVEELLRMVGMAS